MFVASIEKSEFLEMSHNKAVTHVHDQKLAITAKSGWVFDQVAAFLIKVTSFSGKSFFAISC